MAHPAAAALLQLMAGKWVSQALSTAAELGLADALAAGPRTVADLAQETGCAPDPLARLLRALAAVGVFRQVGPGAYQNSFLSAPLLSAAPGSLRDYLRWSGERGLWRALGRLGDTVRGAGPGLVLEEGGPLFDYLARAPAAADVFDRAMSSFSAQVSAVVAREYDFGRYARVADVGGGHGALLREVLSAHPGVQGVLYDRPEVIAGARERWADDPLSARLELAAGDFFCEVPPGADLYVLKNVLHDWGDAPATAVLAACRARLGPGGRVLVVQQLIDEGPEAAYFKLHDLELLALTEGGRERTPEELGALFAAAGLALLSVRPTSAMVSLVEAGPAG